MTDDHQYFLGHSSIEQRRLQQQAGELADDSAWPFGERWKDVGCCAGESSLQNLSSPSILSRSQSCKE